MKNKWLLILGVIAAAVIAAVAGAPVGALLIVGALLLCPAAMYFGMRGMSHGADEKPCCNLETDAAKRETKIEERPKAAYKLKGVEKMETQKTVVPHFWCNPALFCGLRLFCFLRRFAACRF